MRLAAAAYALRTRARNAFAAGDYSRAAQLASEAQNIEASELGEKLARVSQALVGS